MNSGLEKTFLTFFNFYCYQCKFTMLIADVRLCKRISLFEVFRGNTECTELMGSGKKDVFMYPLSSYLSKEIINKANREILVGKFRWKV